MKAKELVIALLVAVLLGGAAWVWLGGRALDAQAPDVTLTRLDGRTLDLAALRGHPVLINFWATSCPGCVAEIPALNALYRQLAPRGLRVIGVAMSYDPPPQVRAMQRARDIAYPIALDTDGRIAKAFGDVQLTPTSFLIDPHGRIVYQRLGALDMAKLRRRIEAMLTRAG